MFYPTVDRLLLKLNQSMNNLTTNTHMGLWKNLTYNPSNTILPSRILRANRWTLQSFTTTCQLQCRLLLLQRLPNSVTTNIIGLISSFHSIIAISKRKMAALMEMGKFSTNYLFVVCVRQTGYNCNNCDMSWLSIPTSGCRSVLNQSKLIHCVVDFRQNF